MIAMYNSVLIAGFCVIIDFAATMLTLIFYREIFELQYFDSTFLLIALPLYLTHATQKQACLIDSWRISREGPN